MLHVFLAYMRLHCRETEDSPGPQSRTPRFVHVVICARSTGARFAQKDWSACFSVARARMRAAKKKKKWSTASAAENMRARACAACSLSVYYMAYSSGPLNCSTNNYSVRGNVAAAKAAVAYTALDSQMDILCCMRSS